MKVHPVPSVGLVGEHTTDNRRVLATACNLGDCDVINAGSGEVQSPGCGLVLVATMPQG